MFQMLTYYKCYGLKISLYQINKYFKIGLTTATKIIISRYVPTFQVLSIRLR